MEYCDLQTENLKYLKNHREYPHNIFHDIAAYGVRTFSTLSIECIYELHLAFGIDIQSYIYLRVCKLYLDKYAKMRQTSHVNDSGMQVSSKAPAVVLQKVPSEGS